MDAAAEAGADAVKFQTFSAAGLATAAAPKAAYQRQTTDPAESQREMLASLELARDAHALIRDRCRDLGIAFLSTPFDEESADFLEDLGVAAFKVPSGELTNLPFLAHVARQGPPPAHLDGHGRPGRGRGGRPDRRARRQPARSRSCTA